MTVHPVRDDGFWASVRMQRGNADDALMRRLYGPGWRDAIGGVPTRLRRHALATALGFGGAALAGARLLGAAPVPARASAGPHVREPRGRSPRWPWRPRRGGPR